MTAPRLEIAIDELVFRGLSSADACVAAAALEAGLTRRATCAPPRARTEAFRRLPPVEAPTESPRALGDAIAGAVWSEVGRGDWR